MLMCFVFNSYITSQEKEIYLDINTSSECQKLQSKIIKNSIIELFGENKFNFYCENKIKIKLFLSIDTIGKIIDIRHYDYVNIDSVEFINLITYIQTNKRFYICNIGEYPIEKKRFFEIFNYKFNISVIFNGENFIKK